MRLLYLILLQLIIDNIRLIKLMRAVSCHALTIDDGDFSNVSQVTPRITLLDNSQWTWQSAMRLLYWILLRLIIARALLITLDASGQLSSLDRWQCRFLFLPFCSTCPSSVHKQIDMIAESTISANSRSRHLMSW